MLAFMILPILIRKTQAGLRGITQVRRIADDPAIFWTVDGIGRVVEQGPTGTILAAPAHLVSASYLSGARG